MAAKVLEGPGRILEQLEFGCTALSTKLSGAKIVSVKVLAGPRDRVGVGWGLQFLSS